MVRAAEPFQRTSHWPVDGFTGERVLQVFEDPDGSYEDSQKHGPDREVRWRLHDDQRVEIVVDVTDDTVVCVWITRVHR